MAANAYLQPLCRSHHRFEAQYVDETAGAHRRRTTARPRPPAPRPVDDSPPPS